MFKKLKTYKQYINATFRKAKYKFRLNEVIKVESSFNYLKITVQNPIGEIYINGVIIPAKKSLEIKINNDQRIRERAIRAFKAASSTSA